MPVEIDRVRAALDPIGVIRDPAKNCCIDLGVINERIGLFGAHPAINSSQASSPKATNPLETRR